MLIFNSTHFKNYLTVKSVAVAGTIVGLAIMMIGFIAIFGYQGSINTSLAHLHPLAAGVLAASGLCLFTTGLLAFIMNPLKTGIKFRKRIDL